MGPDNSSKTSDLLRLVVWAGCLLLDDLMIQIFSEEHPLPTATAGESYIEDMFVHHFRKVGADDVWVFPQQDCMTCRGKRRLDYVLVNPQNLRMIGIECDGKEWHANNIKRDALRDLAIIHAGSIDRIYRLRGEDIWTRAGDAFEIISKMDPWLFSDPDEVRARFCRPIETKDYVSRNEPGTGFPCTHERFWETEGPWDADGEYPEDYDWDNYTTDHPRGHVVVHWTGKEHLKGMPSCPKCRGFMFKRISKQDASLGHEFWGCANFPVCTGTRQIDR